MTPSTKKSPSTRRKKAANGQHDQIVSLPDGVEILTATLNDFSPDPQNLNDHTPRGHSMLTREIQENGIGRPMFATNDRVMKAGNLTQEVLHEVMGNPQAIVVRTRGDVPIIHQRTDIDSGDPRAIEMGIADNWIAHVSMALNAERLAAIDPAITERYFFSAEMDEINEADAEQNISDGSLLSLVNVAIEDPKHVVEHGEVWRLDRHVLICANVFIDWILWQPYLKEGCLFAPFPGPFVALSKKALAVPLVMVQSDPYICGHILDQFEAVHGSKKIKRDH